MKSDKLQEAIGLVDNDLVQAAGEKLNKKRSLRHLKWTVPVAAMLAILIGVGAFLHVDFLGIKNNLFANSNSSTVSDGNSPSFTAKHAVYEAKYPTMSAYPTQKGPEYDRWLADVVKQQQYRGAGKNLDGFFQTTMSEFLSSEGNENVVYSPLNVYFALGMLAETTDGESRDQILRLLGAENIEALRQQAFSVWNANYRDDGTFKSILASSMWLGNNIEYKDSALKNLASYYYASSFKGTMGSDEYNKVFQAWLNEQTGGLLKDYAADQTLDAETFIALATTVYWKSTWAGEFSEEKTTKDVFHSYGKDITCDFMNGYQGELPVYWGDKFTATEKYLKNGSSMWFILPDEGVTVNEWLKDSEALRFMTEHDNWENKKTYKTYVSVPKFDISSSSDLCNGLKNLGVTDCFNANKADFSSLTDQSGIAVSEIQHAARVIINEKGVEAASFTTVDGFWEGIPSPPIYEEYYFVADRPFVFVITNNDGLPLFTGVVNQP